MKSRNAMLRVYEYADRGVVPPFLVGEVAGSLSIGADREELRRFAESILDWLDRTECEDGANVLRFTPRNVG
jgi:hypothetical protein